VTKTEQHAVIYPPATAAPDFAAMERETLEYWRDRRIFERSVELRPSRVNQASNEFVFYDGPPFANGLPHYGHLVTGFVKDLLMLNGPKTLTQAPPFLQGHPHSAFSSMPHRSPWRYPSICQTSRPCGLCS
jgi:tRNA synthetases class I (I, L, M and V)